MDLRVPINVESVGVVAVSSAVLEWKGTSNNSINIFQHNCLLLLFTYVYLRRHLALQPNHQGFPNSSQSFLDSIKKNLNS